MQNIAAPSSEAVTTYRSYYKNNMLSLSYTFYIPVYTNMPESTPLPTKGGWPNNYLDSITINGNKIADFSGDIETYNYYLDINNSEIKLEALPVSNKATVEGVGTFKIESDTTKEIKVTAQNGNVKKYKVNIILTGTLIEDPIDVQTTLNNAGIKNGDKYISGLNVNTDICTIKTKILNANSDATVTLTDSTDSEKSSGIIVTGDKVTIKVGSILHPMTEEHHIVYILLDTKKTRYEMYPYKQKEAPEIIFEIEEDDKPIAVYAVCNLHGLWKFDL